MSSTQSSPGASHAARSRLVPPNPPRDLSRVPSNPRDKRPQHRTTLEPPIAHHYERSSSPRLHAANSPSSFTRRPSQRTSLPGGTARLVDLGGASDVANAHADAAVSPRRHASPHPPRVWPEDEISLPRLRDDPIDRALASSGWSPDALNHLFTSDAILSDLANNTFSSPSTYPSFTTTNQPSQPQISTEDATISPLLLADNMPATTRRRSTTAMPASSPPTTAQGLHAGSRDSGPPAKKMRMGNDEEDPFKSPSPLFSEEPIDLTDPAIPPEQAARRPKSPPNVKLASFQCAICLDNVENMTVTHCGHIFCAQCLHSSLCVESTKGRCPMCRSKIDIKPRDEYNSKTKGFYPIELKLMTKSKKGKRKVGDT